MALANETTLSPAVPGLPVGGIGASGCTHTDRISLQTETDTSYIPDGYYAGRQAFEQFTHWRVSLDNPIWCAFCVSCRTMYG